MAATLHLPKAFSYGWLPQFVRSGRQFRLRGGQWLAVVPGLTTVPYSLYFGAGVTHLIENPGNGPQSGIPHGQRAMMTNGGFLIDGLDNRPFSEWSENEIREKVFGWAGAGGGASMMVSEIAEQLLNSQGRGGADWNTSPQARWYSLAMAEALASQGYTRFYGDYGGHGNLLPQLYGGDLGAIRQALSDDGTALSLYQANSGFGNAFYTGQEYLFREGCLKFYYNADDDAGMFTLGALMSIEADVNARRAAGTNRRVMVCVWPDYYEITDGAKIHHVTYSRDVPAGGRMVRNTVPRWASDTQRALFELILLLYPTNDLYAWSVPGSYGTDPNVASNQTNDGMRYEGSGATLAGMRIGYDPSATACFPTQPEGGQDLICQAAETVSAAQNWAGLDVQQWTAHNSNRHGWTTLNHRTYLLDAYEAGRGLARLGASGSRRWVYYINLRLAPGEWETVTVDLQPGTLTFEAEGGQPYLWLTEAGGQTT